MNRDNIPSPEVRQSFNIAAITIAILLLAAGCGRSDTEVLGITQTTNQVQQLAGPIDAETADVQVLDGGLVGSPEGISDLVNGEDIDWPDRVVVAQATIEQVQAFERPDNNSSVIGDFANPRPSGAELVFQAAVPEIFEGLVGDSRELGANYSADGEWIEVLLPARPNGQTGWIKVQDVELTSNPYRILVDTSNFELRVFEENSLILETTIAVGVGATPTPFGHFFVVELLQPANSDGVYGPYAFGLSGFSETLTEFAGGEAVIGIHGTNEPNDLGTEVSSGCIRISNDAITKLAGQIPLGTPVHVI